METRHNTTFRRKLLRTLLVATCAIGTTSLAVPASAEGWYVGASFGNSKDNDWCSDASSFGFSGSCDDKDSGWKLFAGNQFNKNAAVEFGYVDLGEVSASGTVLGLPVTVTGETTGFNVSLVGVMPVGATSNITGRIGLLRWDVDGSGAVAGIPVSVSDSGTDLTFGVGAAFGIGKNTALRIEWERFQDVAEDDIDLLSLGISFSIQ